MGLQFGFFDGTGDTNRCALESVKGLHYQPSMISKADETTLVDRIRSFPFREFDFHGFKGKRRVVSFGWQYEFSGRGQLHKADEIPDFLLPLRSVAASLADVEPEQLQHALVIEYQPGAGIGWHRDKPVFGEVVGISLLSECVLRFRQRVATLAKTPEIDKAKIKAKFERINVLAEPRSAYHLTGPARWDWEHSILRVDTLRYAITFRTLMESQPQSPQR